MLCIAGKLYVESRHFADERANRRQELEAHIGYGSAFCIVPKDDVCNYVLTDTGILFIINKKHCNIITGYVPSISLTKKLFEQAQMKLPKWYMKVIIRNQKWSL